MTCPPRRQWAAPVLHRNPHVQTFMEYAIANAAANADIDNADDGDDSDDNGD